CAGKEGMPDRRPQSGRYCGSAPDSRAGKQSDPQSLATNAADLSGQCRNQPYHESAFGSCISASRPVIDFDCRRFRPMNREQIRQALQTIFRDFLRNDDISLQDSTTANDIDGWDSLTHVYILLAIETKLGVKFAAHETRQLKNVGDLISSI